MSVRHRTAANARALRVHKPFRGAHPNRRGVVREYAVTIDVPDRVPSREGASA